MEAEWEWTEVETMLRRFSTDEQVEVINVGSVYREQTEHQKDLKGEYAVSYSIVS